MTIEQGQQAPLPDQDFADAEGADHNLKGLLESGPLLLGIYKSSCASSKQMFPFLERLNERYAGDGLTVRGVAQDSANITRSFARRYGISFPMLLDEGDYPISRAFDIIGHPHRLSHRPRRRGDLHDHGFHETGPGCTRRRGR